MKQLLHDVLRWTQCASTPKQAQRPPPPPPPQPPRGRRGGRGSPLGPRRLFVALVLFAVTALLITAACLRARPYRIFMHSLQMVQAPLLELNQTFLVDTPGCRIPNLEVISPEVKEFVYDYGEVSCDELPPLVRSDDEELHLVPEAAAAYGVDADRLRCCTRALWLRQANFTLPDVEGSDNAALAKFTLPPGGSAKFGDVVDFADECTPFEGSVRVPHEYVRVECYSEGTEVYRDFHGFVRPERWSALPPSSSSPSPSSSSSSSAPVTPPGLNVLLLGADNLSRLNLMRSMPRFAAKLRRLGAVTMLGYNKVDDYSYVNLVPLLGGMPHRELERRCLLDNSVFFDPCPWLWKAFRRRGYRTAFMEDTPRLGLFHFYSPGFARQATDVDPRALLLAAERELPRGPRPRSGGTSPVCLGPRFQIQGLFDMALKFIRSMARSGTPFFHYVWGTSLTHDYLNQAQIADEVYERFLEEVMSTGVLNNTALVFLSDHGNRVGPIVTTYQGHMEDRLPVLSVLLPDWVKARYPLAAATLRANSRRLVTVMDVHATLLQLADLRSLEADSLRAAARTRTASTALPTALSLFQEVPDTRTCAQAAIVPHFCSCVHLTAVPTDNAQVQEAAQLLVETVNAALQPHPMCAPLQLHAVRDARRGEPSSLLAKKDAPDRVREQEFLVTVETRPGGALLSGTLRHLMGDNVMKLAGRVTRLNKYGNTSWCAPDRALRLYCYCIDQLDGGGTRIKRTK